MQYGDTALMKAATNGHADCVDIIIKAGADVNGSGKVSTGLTFLLGGPCGPCAATAVRGPVCARRAHQRRRRATPQEMSLTYRL